MSNSSSPNPFSVPLRKKTKDRGYDAAWERVRKFILLRDPICKIQIKCKDAPAVSTEVDHIKPIRFYPELRLDPSNLQGCCKPCNAAKALQDRGKYSFRHDK